MIQRLLTVNEVAALISVSRSTIYRWIGEGRFPKGKKIGPNSTRWMEGDIDEWFNQRINV